MEEPLTLGLLLIPLLSGFIFLRLFPFTRYYAAELEDHGLFINSAAVGAILLAATRLLVVGARRYVPVFAADMQRRMENYAPIPHVGTFLGVFLLSLVLGALGMVFLSRRLALYKSATHADALLRFLLEAHLDKAAQVLFTLPNDRFILGFVFSLFPLGPSPYVRILPLMSGRRASGGIEVETLYEETGIALSRLEAANRNKDKAGIKNARVQLEKLEVVLRRGDILRVEKGSIDYLNSQIVPSRQPQNRHGVIALLARLLAAIDL